MEIRAKGKNGSLSPKKHLCSIDSYAATSGSTLTYKNSCKYKRDFLN